MPRFNIPPGTAVLAGVMLAGAALRIGTAGAQSFWHDEALTAVSARASTASIIETVRQSENCPPAYFILINLWATMFGTSDVSLRMPSALLGAATIFGIYRIARELFEDEMIALTAAALLAVSPFHIAYSQEARPYALLMLLITLCTWAFVRMLRTGSPRAQAAYVLTAAAAMYTHTFALFAIAALNVFYLWRLLRRQETGVGVRRWLILQAAVIVLFGPWIPATREVAQMGLPWMRQPTPFHESMMAYAGGAAALSLLVILILLGMYRGWRERNDAVPLLLGLIIIPVLAPTMYGTFTPRYGIAALIGLTILPAYGAAWIGRGMCIAAVLILSLANLSAPVKPDYRSVARYLIEHGNAGDVFINRCDPLADRVLDYYLAGRGPVRVEKWPAELPPRVWLVTADAAASLPYEIAAQHRFVGVNLLELRPKTSPATEPVAIPHRPE